MEQHGGLGFDWIKDMGRVLWNGFALCIVRVLLVTVDFFLGRLGEYGGQLMLKEQEKIVYTLISVSICVLGPGNIYYPLARRY